MDTACGMYNIASSHEWEAGISIPRLQCKMNITKPNLFRKQRIFRKDKSNHSYIVTETAGSVGWLNGSHLLRGLSKKWPGTKVT